MKPKHLIPLFLVIGITFAIASLGSADTTADLLFPTIASESGCIGSEVVYDFRITNISPIATAFEITYSNTLWPTSGPSGTTTLGVGEFVDIQVAVYIPWTAEPGESDTLILTVKGGGFSSDATVTTTAAFLSDWLDVANAPRGARFSSFVYYDGRLFKIGGDNGGAQPWVDIYTVSSNTWAAGTSMPEARSYIDCEVISGKIYCAGGYTTHGETTLYIYDIASNTWSTGTELPYGVYSYASAALDGKYYLIGGYISGSGYSNATLVYDPILSSWDTTRAPMSTSRRMHSAGVIAGKIYVAGGYNGTYLASAEVYNPSSNSWSAVAPIPAPRVNAADGVTRDRYLILAGGSSEATTSSSADALVYDSSNNTWNSLPDITHAIYGAEGDTDGTTFWFSSGQIYNNGWTASLYTTMMAACETTCPLPVTGADFTWDPADPWTDETVAFTATTLSGSPEISYNWAFDDGSFGTGITINHSFALPLIYTVELTASNCDGASISTKSHDVTIVAPPDIETSPIDLYASLLPDQTAQRQLSICNNGGAPLSWEMSEIDTTPLHLLGELPWLSESATDGVISPDSCITVNVLFSSVGLTEGVYLGSLSISSNDPLNAIVNTPVSLTVSSAAIDLVKTVGLQENTCGTTDQLIVYPDTTVYYCFTVTNTGGVLLDLHDLTDDHLGDLLNAFSYPLSPGASMSVISNGVLIVDNVINEATWYAEAGDYNATASDTAAVTVIPEPDFWVYLPTILKIPSP